MINNEVICVLGIYRYIGLVHNHVQYIQWVFWELPNLEDWD